MNLTRTELLREIEEAERDYLVFSEARDSIRRRVAMVADSPLRLLPFVEWSGTEAVLGTLDLVCHAVGRTIEELKEALGKSKPEPRLKLVKEEDNESEN